MPIGSKQTGSSVFPVAITPKHGLSVEESIRLNGADFSGPKAGTFDVEKSRRWN